MKPGETRLLHGGPPSDSQKLLDREEDDVWCG